MLAFPTGTADTPAAPAKWRSLGLIALLHGLAFYGIYHSLLHRAVSLPLAQEITISLAELPAPPAAPKAVPVLSPPTQTPPPAVFVPPVEAVMSAPAQPAMLSTTPEHAPAPAPAAAPAAPAAPAQTGPRLVTTGVEYLQAPQPQYPPMSRKLGEQGKVVLRVLVNDKGLAESAQVHNSSGSNRLDEAGRQAALAARFKPFTENGRAQAVYVLVTLNFQLQS